MPPTPEVISVIIPVWNGARFLPDAIASIRAQQDDSLEIIVIDDGSTDDTAVVTQGFPEVRYIRQENQGPSAARNTGLHAANGGLIAFLDVDDQWPPGKLERQRARLAEDPELDLVLGRVQYRSLAGAVEVPIRFEDQNNTVTHVHLGSGLFRRRAFARVGGFDPDMRFSEDQDWFLRAREAGLRITILEDITLEYYLHENNMTRGRGLDQLQVLAALRKSIARRRAGGRQDLGQWSDFDEKCGPLVSVIIPVYNGERYLAEAIESVTAQEYRPLEIIVVDDGAVDRSVAIASCYPEVRVVSQANAGVGAARNHGVRLAQGALVAFLDQDDLWVPGRLASQVRTLNTKPEVAMAVGRQEYFLEPGIERPAWLRTNVLGSSQTGYNLGAILIRRDALDRLGPFDETHRTASDVDWFFRVKDAGLRIAHMDEVAMRHRIHEANQSHLVEEQHREYVRLARSSVLRMRARSTPQ